jgi:hypothetical protein
MKGFAIDPSESDGESLLAVAAFLGNTELLHQFLNDTGLLNEFTVLPRLRKKSAVGISVDSEIEFAAAHFYELQRENEVECFKLVDISVLERIVTSPALCLRGEDSLLTFICRLERAEEMYLLRYLRSEYLSTDGMELFLTHLSDSTLDALIWPSLCRRLLLPVWVQKSCAEVLAFRTTQRKSLDGIISHLTKECGRSVHDEGIVTITAQSKQASSRYSPHNVVALDTDSFFASADCSGQWICWDFGNLRVHLTHYTFSCCQLKSWIVEGSLDGESWAEIDRHTDNQDFNDRSWQTASFSVSRPMQLRFIRLTQTGKRHDGNDFLTMRAAEFFGDLSK